MRFCRSAQQQHPDVAIDGATLVAAIARTSRGSLEGIDRCHATDLALAIAAGAGDPAAIAAIERLNDATLGAVCHRFAGGGHTVDDLRQILRAKLYVGERPRIADYEGQGTLTNWLRVTAVRVFIDLTRRKDRAREALVVDELPEMTAALDVALVAIKAEYRAAVSAALAEAIAGMLPADRVILRQHLAFQMSIDELGAALGLHRATAARRIARARDALVASVRHIVAARLAIDAAELGEVCDLVASGIEMSLRELFASQPATAR